METEKRNKKIGIMGGTFNPIHIGHLLLAENAREHFALDEILFIPSGYSYMKNETEVADKQMRLEMTRLAIEDNPSFTLSSIEVDRAGNTYTCETLKALKEREPENEFYFIVGADSLFSMETWRQPEDIFGQCIILAAVRDDKDKDDIREQMKYLEEKYGANIRQIPFSDIAISSTDIRKKISEGRSVRYMVPDRVISYIEAHDLYREAEDGNQIL